MAPPTLLPQDLSGWPCSVSHDLDEALPDLDVAYLLRIQIERGGSTVFPSLPEYVLRYGLTVDRLARMPDDAVVMHPGPMNRGIEIAPEIADGPRSLVLDQVRLGVAVRMAVLFRLGAGAREEVA